MRKMCSGSTLTIELMGQAVSGALERHSGVAGFCQAALGQARLLLVGAGGLISHIAPTAARKGIGQIALVDDDVVEANNLNRQFFYKRDIGSHKAVALARNLQRECTARTRLIGLALRFEEAAERGVLPDSDVAVCGVDNNPCRTAASAYFRRQGVPVIFTAVSRDADHGYVFVQDCRGACIGCLFPDMVSDERYPCPGTPAIADVLQAVGALTVYAIDSLLMTRPRSWNYRRISLADVSSEGAGCVAARPGCPLCAAEPLR
jgi:molybdopterin/thiamine biosynthesis adenylyltransferase